MLIFFAGQGVGVGAWGAWGAWGRGGVGAVGGWGGGHLVFCLAFCSDMCFQLVFCSCSVFGEQCSKACSDALNGCCVQQAVRAEQMFMFGERCSAPILLLT